MLCLFVSNMLGLKGLGRLWDCSDGRFRVADLGMFAQRPEPNPGPKSTAPSQEL